MKRVLVAATLAISGLLSAAPALAGSTFTDTVSQIRRHALSGGSSSARASR